MDWFRVYTLVRREVNNGYETLYGSPLYAEYFPNFSIAYFLSTFGQPSNVLIFANEDLWQLSLLLYYQELGIFTEFIMPIDNLGDKYIACSSEAITHLWLWSPEKTFPMLDILAGDVYNVQYLGPSAGYFSVEEATSLTLNEFTESFSDPDSSSCIEASAFLWE